MLALLVILHIVYMESRQGMVVLDMVPLVELHHQEKEYMVVLLPVVELHME